jgi:hypothetical protein
MPNVAARTAGSMSSRPQPPTGLRPESVSIANAAVVVEPRTPSRNSLKPATGCGKRTDPMPRSTSGSLNSSFSVSASMRS